MVEPAATHALAALVGSSTKGGVVGYTLGGGFGWLGRKYGPAVHSVTRAEVVTADADLVSTGPEDHPDLFWGVLGSAGNLGIVTALEFRLHPVQQVYAGNLYFPLERARHWWMRACRHLPPSRSWPSLRHYGRAPRARSPTPSTP